MQSKKQSVPRRARAQIRVGQISWPTGLLVLFVLISSGPANAAGRRTVIVSSNEQLKRALQQIEPGTTVRLKPGVYSNLYWASLSIEGREQAPITIEAADKKRPPIIDCCYNGAQKKQGIYVRDANYLVLRGLVVKNARDNGILVAHGTGSSWRSRGRDKGLCHHIRVENCTVLKTNPNGNHDAIKLSGVEYFTVSNCRIDGWGGSAVDANGSRCGVIENSVFECASDVHNNSAITLKGGGDSFLVQRNVFRVRSAEQVVRIGDPDVANASQGMGTVTSAEVAGNWFVSGVTPIAWLSSDGGNVHHNTICYPKRRMIRSWGRFDRDGPSFHHNLILFNTSDLLRVGQRIKLAATPSSALRKFRFTHNAWYEASGGPADVRTELPVAETDGLYGVDPGFRCDIPNSPPPSQTARDNRLRKIGAQAYSQPEREPAGYGWQKNVMQIGPSYDAARKSR